MAKNKPQKSNETQGNRLYRYVNELIIQLYQDRRELVQARYAQVENSFKIRSQVQGDIMDLYWALYNYRNRAMKAWENANVVGNGSGLNAIQSWERMNETVENKTDDFSGSSEQHTQPRVLSRLQLIKASAEILDVADEIGFHAIGNDQRPFEDWGDDYDDGV